MLPFVTYPCDPLVVHEDARLPPVTPPRVTATPIHGGTAGAIDQQVRDTAMRGDSLFDLDAPRIIDAHPDVILTQALCDVCAVSETDVRRLAADITPSPQIVTLAGTTVSTIFDDIRHVAAALCLHTEGDELIAGLTTRLRRIHRTLTSAAAPRPRVAVIEWTDPLYAAGHWVPELVAHAGGTDVLATPGEHSTTRTVTQLRDAAPEVLLFAQCGYDTERAAHEATTLLSHPDWSWARDIAILAIDANAFTSRPGPKIVTGVELIAAALHPTLFPPPSATHLRHVFL